jgi:hypothetical protein
LVGAAGIEPSEWNLRWAKIKASSGFLRRELTKDINGIAYEEGHRLTERLPLRAAFGHDDGKTSATTLRQNVG